LYSDLLSYSLCRARLDLLARLKTSATQPYRRSSRVANVLRYGMGGSESLVDMYHLREMTRADMVFQAGIDKRVRSQL